MTMAADDAAGGVERSRFSSRDEREVTEFIQRMYIGNRLRFDGVGEDARFAAVVAQLGDLATDRVSSTVDFTATCDPFSYLGFLTLGKGRMRIRDGDRETVAQPGAPSFYPLGVPLRVSLVDADVQSLRIPLHRVHEVAREAGVPPGSFRFHDNRAISPARARYWQATTGLIHTALLDPDSPMVHPLVAEEMTRMAAVAALATFPNTTMSRHLAGSPGRVAPAALRRAVDYLEEHAHQPIHIDQAVTAAGVSPRALQYAFRHHLGTTPTEYLRRIRLERAHAELQAADPTRGATVASIAARWGFLKPSRFAAAYRRAYGFPPSRTLRA